MKSRRQPVACGSVYAIMSLRQPESERWRQSVGWSGHRGARFHAVTLLSGHLKASCREITDFPGVLTLDG